jgi:hypothetical protein
MEVTLEYVPVFSELNEWKIQEKETTLGYLYVGPSGMSIDWVAFADGHEWPKVNNIIDAIRALQEYFDMRWHNGSLVEPVRIV